MFGVNALVFPASMAWYEAEAGGRIGMWCVGMAVLLVVFVFCAGLAVLITGTSPW